MKLRLLKTSLLFAGLLIFLPHFLLASVGGPDPYGYIWKDSNEPGVSIQWVDIVGRAGTTQVPSLGDDNAVGPFSIGWDFHYYWSDYNSVKIGSNGWISFNNVGNIASCFPQVPSVGGVGDNIIAPFMSDLTFVSSNPQAPNPGRLYYWTNNVDSFVIQWVNVPWWQNATTDWVGSNTFELILSGVDSSITFQYLDTDAANFPGGTGCTTFMEIGIENVTGDLGLNYSTGNAVPGDNYAVKYIYPSGASFLVPDATPVWSMGPDNEGIFVYSHLPVVLSSNIANVGNTPISSTITLSGQVADLQLVAAWTDTTQTQGLSNGSNVTLQFLDTLRLPIPGQYFFDVRSETAQGQDINPTNNTNTVEIVSVSNNGGKVQLSYATGALPSTAVSWAGGNATDGVGIKIVPPDFPAILDSVQVYLTADGDPQTPAPVGYRIVIHGLDSNGQPDPNNILSSTVVPANAVVEDAWNTVVPNGSVTVSSGGFAVAWMQQGSGIALGAEQYGPISRRSYEILGGTWGRYRSNEDTEFLIRAFTGLPVGTPEPISLLADLKLAPNPAAGKTRLHYRMQQAGELDIQLIDLQGRLLWSASMGSQAVGPHSLEIPLDGLAAGLYCLRMRQAAQAQNLKLVVAGNR